MRDRVEGLLIGAYLGDALGGPAEFQDPERIQELPHPPKHWFDDEVLDKSARAAAAARVRLIPYAPLRPVPEPYAHWSHNAAPGTITDDSRHKLVLFHALRQAQERGAGQVTASDLARAYLEWPPAGVVRERAEMMALCDEWLTEMRMSARWVLGERDTATALPSERLWSGLPTCCGQMTLPPLAALYPGDPEGAYRAAYEVGFFDNGFGKDLNAALLAGLALALALDVDQFGREEAWKRVFSTMRQTDPFRYAEVPWTPRSVDRWLDVALNAARDADQRPARMFARLNEHFSDTIKWEAQVPYVVTFACLAIADYDPLAALQLSVEWGHDTDSDAQLVGAFVGALHGAKLFPADVRTTIEHRLVEDYGASLQEQVDLLLSMRQSFEQGRHSGTE